MKSLNRPLHLREGEVLYFDKPLGWTSFDLVNKFRNRACRWLGVKKLRVGHAGTLDPLATGVMIVCTGRATKQIETLQEGMKEYIATVALGVTTPSFDRETEPDAYFPFEHICREDVLAILPQFMGETEQVPPAFSALMVDGKRAYKMARKGQEVKLKPRLQLISELELLDFEPGKIVIRVLCNKGTYIRALARDIGSSLGSGAHLAALQRTKVGEALLENCLQIDELEEFFERCGLADEPDFAPQVKD